MPKKKVINMDTNLIEKRGAKLEAYLNGLNNVCLCYFSFCFYFCSFYFVLLFFYLISFLFRFQEHLMSLL